MPFTDAYLLRAIGQFAGQRVVNLVTFERNDATMHAADLVASYDAIIWQTQRLMLSTNFTMESLEAQSLGDPLDFHAAPPSNTAGVVSATENTSPFIALGVRFNRTRTDMHHGWIRFSGFREEAISGNVFTSTRLAQADVVAQRLTEFLLSPTLPPGGFYHTVVKRVKYITPGGKVAYRLPVEASEYVAYFPTTYLVQSAVTTQNTRKPGRGS